MTTKEAGFNDLTFSHAAANARISAAKGDFKAAIEHLLEAQKTQTKLREMYEQGFGSNEADARLNRETEIGQIVEYIANEIHCRIQGM